MRRFSLAVMLVTAAIVAGALVGAMPQPLQDPWYRPLNPQGGSAGVTYGQTAPSLASIGANPGQGELWVDTNGAGDGGPVLNIYDHVNTAWDAQLTSGGLTADVIPVFDGVGLIDSTVTDDAVDVVATGGLITSGLGVGLASSILLDGNNSEIVFEGGTEDGFEITLSAVDPATDLLIQLDNPAASTDGVWVTIAAGLAQQDAGNIFRGIHLDLDSPPNHLGAASIRGIELDNDAATALGTEVGLYYTATWDVDIGWVNAGQITLGAEDQAATFTFEDVIDHSLADTVNHYLEIDATLTALDAGDTQSGLFVDLTWAGGPHTGGNIYGVNIDGITQDPQAEEAAIFVGAEWDADIHFGAATAQVWWFETGLLEISDYGGQNEIIFNDVAADNAVPNTVMELDPTLSIMDAGGDIQRILHLDIDNVNHTNGSVYGVHFDNDTNDAQSAEIAAVITDTWDIDVAWPDAGDLILGDLGGDMTFTLEDVPDLTGADAAVALVEIDFTPGIIDAGDTLTGLLVDVGTAVHTGGDVIGINVDDAAATAAAEYAQRFGTGWDREIDFADTTAVVRHAGEIRFMDTLARGNIYFRDVPAAGTGEDIVDLDLTLTAMDGAGDFFRGLLIDIANANHSAGNLYAIDVDSSANDPDAYETAIYANGNFDSHLTFEAAAASPADNPPAGTIALYIDDQTDWSGGGGNDCCLIAKDSGGATDIIATLVLDGACP